MPRPRLDHVRKAQIIAAAAAVLSERGYANTRVVDIAREAGTSPAAVLYWFDGKDALLAEALRLQEQEFHDRYVDALKDLIERKRKTKGKVIEEVDANGGTIKLIDEGWFQRRIADFAYDTALKKASGEKPVIGVNMFVEPEEKADILARLQALGERVAFVGDALFNGGVGRTDLPGGDYAELERSIRTQIYTLPSNTVVYPGHGPATTVGDEKALNPFVRG